MKKKILITGGSGFLGINLAKKLKKNYKVYLSSRNQKNNFLAHKITSCQTYPMDICNINSIRDVLKIVKPDIVIHAAATKFVDLAEKFPFECVDVNILGSSNICRACIESNVKTVIGISTDKATQPIKNFYGLSKAVMEKLFCNLNTVSKTNFLCVRYGNVAWSTGSVLPIWKDMYLKNKKILTTGPYMRRFFFTINEATELVSFALKNYKKFSGKIVSVNMKSARMIDILKTWKKYYKCDYRIISQRKGDRQDEYLISENELNFTKKIKEKNKTYFVIDFNKSIKKTIKQIISSGNAEKLSQNEIKKIIDLGMKAHD